MNCVFFSLRFYTTQKVNSKILWKDPEILKDIVTNEVVVAGVYLRLFVSNPAWTLRKPKQFLSDLLDFVVDQISKSSSEVSFEVIIPRKVAAAFLGLSPGSIVSYTALHGLSFPNIVSNLLLSLNS